MSGPLHAGSVWAMPAALDTLADPPTTNRLAADHTEANGQANGSRGPINLLLLCGRAVEELPELEASLPPGAHIVGVGRDAQELRGSSHCGTDKQCSPQCSAFFIDCQ